MRKRKVYILVLFCGLIGISLGFHFGIISFGRITFEMCKDFGYYRWTHGSGPFIPEYKTTFLRDVSFRNQFIGRPIQSLQPLFPKLHSGATYNPDSYRGKHMKYHLETRYAGVHVEPYWIDGTEEDFGLCVVVVDGKIREFILIKG